MSIELHAAVNNDEYNNMMEELQEEVPCEPAVQYIRAKCNTPL
jgi:hypothetical protein